MLLFRMFVVLAAFSVAAGDASAASDLKYRVRKRLCQLNDTCDEGGTSSSSGGSSSGGSTADTVAPIVSTFLPADGAVNVAIDVNLVITFSENVQKGTGNIIIKKSSDNTVVETIPVSDAKVDIVDAVVTINPEAALASGMGYYVTVDSGAFADMSDNAFAGISGSTAWNFVVAGVSTPQALQGIPTVGALDWEPFTVDGETYLALASYYNGSSYNINSTLYRFVPTNPDSSKLVAIQSIPTNGAAGWEAFTVDGETYLVLANYYNGSSYNINSMLYRFVPTNPDSSKLVAIQSIPTNGASDWDAFTVGGETYLVLANFLNNSSFNIDSKLYRFVPTNPDSGKLVAIQAIPTNGAQDWEAFAVGGETYLTVANHYNESSYSINSTLYRFVPANPDASKLVAIQAIPTNGALSWEAFAVGGETYLAVANIYDGSSYNINSTLYRFVPTNPDASKLVAIQPVPTNGGVGSNAFTFGGETYLAIADSYNGSSYNIDSGIYCFVPANPDASKLVEIQAVPTNSAHDWESFAVDGEPYLVVANQYNGSSWSIDSRLYRFQP